MAADVYFTRVASKLDLTRFMRTGQGVDELIHHCGTRLSQVFTSTWVAQCHKCHVTWNAETINRMSTDEIADRFKIRWKAPDAQSAGRLVWVTEGPNRFLTILTKDQLEKKEWEPFE